MPADASTNRIAGLEALLKAQAGKGPAPVEKWNPPYCGDIGMKIRADGVWLYQGSPIGRMPLVKLFAGVLRKDADGKHYLVTPAEKVDVAVADAPFLAVEMEVRGSGREQTPRLPHQRRRHRRRPARSIRCASRSSRAARASSPTSWCAAGWRRSSRARSTTISSSWRSTRARAWACGARASSSHAGSARFSSCHDRAPPKGARINLRAAPHHSSP